MTVRRYRLISFLVLVLLMLLTISGGVLAQDNPIIISLTLPEYTTSIFNENVFDEFEAANPGVKVQINKVGMDMYYPSAAGSLDQHLESAAKYVSSADVLYVNSFNLSVESTRAGYFLDLTPLTSIDTTLNPEDFVPAAWESYQWDGGMWAMPLAATVYLMMYQPDKFDAAGLPYPNEAWTFEDLGNAARALAQTDETGAVTVPGFVSQGNLGLLLHSLSGETFYDSSILPNPPLFANPNLESLLTAWAELTDEGYADSFVNSPDVDVPLRIEQSFLLSNLGSTGEQNWQGTLLPGGIAGLNVEAFAISSGTQYPEQAYALLKFLTDNVEIVSSFFSDTPARRSLIGVESENGLQNLITRSPEVEALVQDALTKAVPVSELRYREYVENAVSAMNDDGVDALTALQEAETQAVQNLQTAESRRPDTVVFVATPIATPILNTGEISLKFGLTSFFTPFPNREAWLQAIDDFTAIDPQVRQITFDTGVDTQVTNMSEQYDCFYMPYNIVPSTTDLSPLLNLDPFMSADPNFDNNDIVGNTLAQLQKDNKTWGYPIVIQPQVLQYNGEMFQDAGVPQPENGWTIEAFRDALEQLKATAQDTDEPPFISNSFGGNHLLVLISAYGGVPLDYRTTPVTVNFTDPATVEAIRQVLDLAKDGYIKYSALGSFSGGFFGNVEAPIVTASLDSATLFQFAGNADEATEVPDDPYLMTLFPTGNQFNGVSYDIGTGYISANAQNPDACYRWLGYVSERPELLGAMPAKRSVINNGDITASQGEEVTAVYNQIDTLLQNPNTVAFPSPLGSVGSPGDLILQLWLYRAFDSYVLEDGDLDAELAEAETFSKAYQGCVANIPPYTLGADATQQDLITYFRQYTDCAASVDPSLESLFGF
jgi:ABC-type glycerol-3-phosphate transport system substrate-binding protein